MRLLYLKYLLAAPLLLVFAIIGEAKEHVMIEKFRPLDPWIVRQIKKDAHRHNVGKRMYIMYLDDQAIGFIRFGVIHGKGVITRISVHPGHHKKGFGALLDQFARSEFKKEHIQHIEPLSAQKTIKPAATTHTEIDHSHPRYTAAKE